MYDSTNYSRNRESPVYSRESSEYQKRSKKKSSNRKKEGPIIKESKITFTSKNVEMEVAEKLSTIYSSPEYSEV